MRNLHSNFTKLTTLVLFTLFSISIFPQTHDIPQGYYSAADGLSGYSLKTALHNIIKNGHSGQSYGDLYDAYTEGDTDPEDGKVWDMYSENPDGADPYNFTHYQNQCGNYSSEGDCYNREHLFPQGIFNSASPMKSDYHHVVPSDGKVNGMRGSYPFGETDNPGWTSLNGSKRGPCSYPGYSGTIFEPIDEFKGDIARCMLYFATRYQDKVAGWSHTMLDGSSDQVYADWFIEMLVEWHLNDPVSSKDIMRNEAGYDFQGNRNPFIDHPEYVTTIWGGNSPAVFSGISLDPVVPTSADDVNVSATITDAEGISSVNLNWGTSSGSLGHTIAMDHSSGNVYETTSAIPAQVDGTSVYYNISVTDNDEVLTSSSVQYYTVGSGAFPIFFEDDFESGNLNKWYTYSTTGSQEWIVSENYGIDDSKCAKMSGYESEHNTNEDWLITSEIDLTHVSDGVFSFFSACNYSGYDIEVKYSTDYSGSGNPGSATWNDFTSYSISQGSWEWTNSGNISLSPLKGNKIHIAFKYLSNNTESKTWELDNVKVTGTIESTVNFTALKEFSIYPNPSSGKTNLEFEKELNNLLFVFQTDGRLVFKDIINGASKILNLDSLEKGTYFIKINGSEEYKTKKLIIE